MSTFDQIKARIMADPALKVRVGRMRVADINGILAHAATATEASEAANRTLTAEVDRLKEALKPFADLAAPRHPEEGGAPSHVDILTNGSEHDELELRSYVAASDHIVTLTGSNFRAARTALTHGADNGQ